MCVCDFVNAVYSQLCCTFQICPGHFDRGQLFHDNAQRYQQDRCARRRTGKERRKERKGREEERKVGSKIKGEEGSIELSDPSGCMMSKEE